MIRAQIQGPVACVPLLRDWVEFGDDCSIWVHTSPTKHLGCVYQLTGDYLMRHPVKESKQLAGFLSESLRHAFGGTGRIRPPGLKDFELGTTDHLRAPMPACLVYLPPDKHHFTEGQGKTLAAAAIYTGLSHFRLWCMGQWK